MVELELFEAKKREAADREEERVPVMPRWRSFGTEHVI